METLTHLWFLTVVLTLLVFSLSIIWLAIQAFLEHYLWGLAVMFLPMAQVVFAVLHWDRARRPFLVGLAAGAALVIELLLTGGFQALTGG